jgi:glycosyltransferase involved in cell wall biosynthesis
MNQGGGHGDLVSVVMSAYNHADYIGEAIESVLNQSHESLEFLITDDGSTDGTLEKIKIYKDPRIKYISAEENRGACAAINELIKKTQGSFVCIINSDDAWRDRDKLKKQLDIFEERKELGACFGLANFIDQNGNNIHGKAVPDGTTFDYGNKTRGKWLRQFFLRGNNLCHPTVMIKKECYRDLGLYNNIYRQLPDYDMWIRLVKKYEIYVSEEHFTDFRILPGRNASSPTTENVIRDLNEHYLIRKTLFENTEVDMLVDGFGANLIKQDLTNKLQREIEIALLYFIEDGNFSKINALIGLEKISKIMSSAVHAEVANKEYGIDSSWLHKKSGEVSTIFESMTHRGAAPTKSRVGESILLSIKTILSETMLKFS